jgi:hypothetical protein
MTRIDLDYSSAGMVNSNCAPGMQVCFSTSAMSCASRDLATSRSSRPKSAIKCLKQGPLFHNLILISNIPERLFLRSLRETNVCGVT